MAKGLIFNLNFQDLARSMQDDVYELGLPAGYESRFSNNVRQQRIIFSITWMFGQFQQHKNRKVGDFDELNRLGGGGGVHAGN